jgi:hypothetical protein
MSRFVFSCYEGESHENKLVEIGLFKVLGSLLNEQLLSVKIKAFETMSKLRCTLFFIIKNVLVFLFTKLSVLLDHTKELIESGTLTKFINLLVDDNLEFRAKAFDFLNNLQGYSISDSLTHSSTVHKH